MENKIVYEKKRIFTFISILLSLFLISLVFGGYSYYKYKKIENNKSLVDEKRAKNLINKLSKIYLSPEEEPVIATVYEPEKLRNDSFFELANKDDVVFIYTKTMKAILYRPSLDKIIEIRRISENDKLIDNKINSIPLDNNNAESAIPAVGSF